MTEKRWTDEEIKACLIETGYSLQPIRSSSAAPFKVVIETNEFKRQYYRWVQVDSEGNVTWFGNKMEAAKRAKLFSFNLRY